MRRTAPHTEAWDKAALRDAILRLARIFALATLALWATRTYGAELGADTSIAIVSAPLPLTAK